MLTAQDGDCTIYHGHGLLSAFQFPPIAQSKEQLKMSDLSRAQVAGYSVSREAELHAGAAALQQRRVEGPKAFAEKRKEQYVRELGESSMKRFIDFDQFAA
jgi:hypothetical protein